MQIFLIRSPLISPYGFNVFMTTSFGTLFLTNWIETVTSVMSQHFWFSGQNFGILWKTCFCFLMSKSWYFMKISKKNFKICPKCWCFIQNCWLMIHRNFATGTWTKSSACALSGWNSHWCRAVAKRSIRSPESCWRCETASSWSAAAIRSAPFGWRKAADATWMGRAAPLRPVRDPVAHPSTKRPLTKRRSPSAFGRLCWISAPVTRTSSSITSSRSWSASSSNRRVPPSTWHDWESCRKSMWTIRPGISFTDLLTRRSSRGLWQLVER